MSEVIEPSLHQWEIRRSKIETDIIDLLGRRPSTIYEAGGPAKMLLSTQTKINAYTVVVDVCEQQFGRCDYAAETIVADIQNWKRSDYFDLICCTDVLEHVPCASDALKNLATSLAPGGVCVITGPVPTSLRGWITRLTPHAFHIFYYRKILGKKNAGLPGHAPFRTIFSYGTHPRTIRKILKEFGVNTTNIYLHEDNQSLMLKDKNRLFNIAFSALSKTLFFASFGRYQPRLSMFVLIAQKPVR